MKPANFPARKLRRQMEAQGINSYLPENEAKITEARKIRTKKSRISK